MVTTKGGSSGTRSSGRTTQRSKAATPARGSRGASPAGKDAGPGVLGAHAADLWALGLITVGILLGLAVYGAALGPVGRSVDSGLGYLIGWSRYIVPPLCVLGGAAIIAGRTRPDPTRTVLGGVLGLVAVSGLAELAGGSPTFSSSHADLSAAGGVLGVAVGHSLERAIGTAGAAVVFVVVAIVAVLLATGISLRALGRGTARASALVGRSLGRWWGAGAAAEDTDRKSPTPVAAEAEPPWTPPEDTAAPGVDHDTGEILGPEPVPARAPRAVPAVPAKKKTGPGPAVGEWHLPAPSMLHRSKQQRQDERLVDAAGEALVSALAAHGVDTHLVGRTIGPTVTRFELELGLGVKVARVTSLSKDVAYAMASPDVRILAPIPGKSAIGVEVPNRQRQLVSLGDILASDEADAAVHPLEVALGRDIAGRAVLVNLAEMPHVLISGATGAGKSSCINSLVTSILMRATPDQVRMILVDPKRVELGQYNGLPHLLTPVVVDPKKAANALAWAVKEMERRYDLLAEYGVRDITGFNEAYDRGDLGPRFEPSVRQQVQAVADKVKREAGAPFDAEAADDDDIEELDEAVSSVERLPFILVVVDELNDLMMVAARDVEDSVVRIAQMARAVGIHLVLATQRPSVDVITGVIKANVPSRMAFSVSSLADSRVILDQPGAERLIGKGDMLVLTASSNIPRRLQGPWVSEEEVRAVVAHWRRQGRVPEPVVGIDTVDTSPGAHGAEDDDDELLAVAMELVVRSQLGSTSMLQRKLRVGFARAGRLMDLLEQRGVVGPSEGSKARSVLMTTEEFDARH